jgi:adenylate cyclase
VTEAIVAAIEPNLRRSEIERAQSTPTNSLTAYDLHLRALSEVAVLEQLNFARAEQLLQRAIELDPLYSDAFALLAHIIGMSGLNAWRPLPESTKEALAAARNAVRLDNSNPVALATGAYAEAVYEGSYERSDDCAERALALAPGSASVRWQCGHAYAYGGASDLALLNLETAIRLSPLDPQAYRIYQALNMAHVFARRFEEAERWARRCLANSPHHVPARRYLAVALAHLGRIDEARAVVADLLRLAPRSSLHLSRTSHFRHTWQMDIYIEGLRAAGLPE